MDRRQNNGSVKAVSPRHCPATCALRNCCFNCCAWTVTKTMSVAPLLTNNLDNSSKGSPTFLAQLHLPTHDLFWAKLRVQLHLPPIRSHDLLISPGTPDELNAKERLLIKVCKACIIALAQLRPEVTVRLTGGSNPVRLQAPAFTLSIIIVACYIIRAAESSHSSGAV